MNHQLMYLEHELDESRTECTRIAQGRALMTVSLGSLNIFTSRNVFCNVLQPCCNTLQYTATHCNTLQYTGSRIIFMSRSAVCNVLQHTATCNTLQHAKAVTRCNVLRGVHTTTHCNVLQHTTAHCNTLQHKKDSGATCADYNTLQYAAAHCNTLRHTETHCNTRQTVL